MIVTAYDEFVISVNWLCWDYPVVLIRSIKFLDIVPAICYICHWRIQFKTVDSIPSHCTSLSSVSQPLLCPQVATSLHCSWLGVSPNVYTCFKSTRIINQDI
jgi:hypothetical protein